MKTITIAVKDHLKSLLEILREEGYYFPASCGGWGTCGKCRVRFRKNPPPPDRQEVSLLTEEDLGEGWRLACRSFPLPAVIEIEIPEHYEEEIQAAGGFDFGDKTQAEDRLHIHGKTLAADDCDAGGTLSLQSDSYALAIDLGTTTIAAGLIDTAEKKWVKTVTGINHQRVYGADVVSRIDAGCRGEGPALRELVMKDIRSLCRRLGLNDHVESLPIPVILSGNTTMLHLLQGLPCESLGVFPFTPVDISMHRYGNMTILPGISTYVGADIVSGIIACGIDRREEVSVLVDLGTNGEMVIGNRNRILAASAAAGPAFEGGNISCGIAGVPGAVDRVEIHDGRTRITTIGDAEPTGICGSGVVETVYELVKEEIVDETGLLDEKYFDDGFPLTEEIRFTAGDVREVQLAKAAVRAGIEVLLAAWGTSCGQVDRLYLAGGFGQKINCAKAAGIGMLPEELTDRVVAVGNSSLEGAGMLAMDPELAGRFLHVTEISEEITLANHPLFNDLFMKYMFFGE